MTRTVAEAFELLIQADQLAPRLKAAEAAMAQLTGVDDERIWLAAAVSRLGNIRGNAPLVARALRLSELSGMKAEHGKLLQIAVAEGVERLQAAITIAGTARSPLHDTLFLELKIPALIKCSKTELERFCVEIERRLATSYARRLLDSERYASVVPSVTALRSAISAWGSVFVGSPLEGTDADALRAELLAASMAIEIPIRQARLLAQAALLSATELLDAAGVLTPLGKKRAASDTHPILEKDPPDPLLPTAKERAEIAALRAS